MPLDLTFESLGFPQNQCCCFYGMSTLNHLIG
jgi:hypothetical protein